MLIPVFEKAFQKMRDRGWDCIAVGVDLHDTVFRSTYSEELATEFYPLAEETLQLLSRDPRVRMYMYTCTPPRIRASYKKFLSERGIIMESNPGVVMSTMKIRANNFQSYDNKPYFNVLLDDKAGFDPNRDWIELNKYIKQEKR